MSKLEELKRHNAKKRFIDPEQSEENHGQNDDYDSDKHAGHMFLAVLDEKKVLVDVPRKVDPKKLGIDLIGNIIMTGMDDERLESLKNILQKAPGKVSLYMTQALRRELDEKLGDFDKVDEHIVKEARDFDVNGVNVTLMKVEGSNELKVILRSGEEYHQGNWISKEDIREKLASMIHNEWMSWSKAVAGDVDPARKAKWEKLWIPYDQLTEPQKDQDRIWADKVLKVMYALNKGEDALVDILSLIKARGVPLQSGPPPGPPPREGLTWKPDSHRWLRPEEEKKTEVDKTNDESEKIHRVEADFIGDFATAEIEHVVVIDKNGEVVFTKKGSKDSVFFTNKEARKLYGSEEFMHNHPFGGGSFSFEDIVTQYRLHIKRMVVVNGNQKFTIELGDKDWEEISSLHFVFQFLIEDTQEKFMKQCLMRYFTFEKKAHDENRKVSRDEDKKIKQLIEADAWIDQTDYVWKELSKMHRFNYTRETVDVNNAIWDKIERQLPQMNKAIDLSDGYTLDDSAMWVPEAYHKTLEAREIIKAQGVPEGYGAQPPGPPPRPGLQWKPETHRWIRPGEEHTEATSSVQYETENKDMTEALSALKVSDVEYADVGDSWIPETVGILKDNADAHLGQYEKFFDATTYNKARSAAYAVINSARGAKTSAAPKDVQDLVTSSIDKLVYQEMRAWERQVSDHGIRHIVGNMTVQDRISRALISGGGKITPQERFMMNIIAINHDMGYTMGDARISIEGTKKHKRYSQEFFDHEREFYKKFFDDTQLDLMSDIIAHHDDTNVDWVDDPVMTTVCMADNLSLFHEDKLPSLYRYVEGALDSLYEMQKGLRANDPDAVANAKIQLLADIDTSKLPEYSKSWLRQAANEVSKYTVKYTIPMLIGNVEGFDYEENKGLAVNINEDPFDSKIADVIDMGQTQYAKFAKDYDVDLKDNDTVEFKKNGRVHLTMNIKRNQMKKSVFGEYTLDMIIKMGKSGITSNREGKSLLETTSIKSDVEGGDIYKKFMDIDYNKFFGRREKSTNEAIIALKEELDKQRIAKMGSEKHYRNIDLISDWVDGVLIQIVSLMMIGAKMNDEEFTKDQLKGYLNSVILGIGGQTVDMLNVLCQTMSHDIDALKVEKKFTEEKARELFGDNVTLYRGVHGSVVKEILEKLNKNGKIELEELPMSSYSQDEVAAIALVHKNKDWLVYKTNVLVTDISTAWFSNPVFVTMMPEQRECIVNRKIHTIVVNNSDIVKRNEDAL